MCGWNGVFFSGLQVYECASFSHQKYINGVSFSPKIYMNRVNFLYGKYMNGSCFSLSLVYELGEVRGLQPHVRTKNHGKLPPV